MCHDDQLSSQEEESLRSLSRERMASRMLEERTVHALRETGFLRVRKSLKPVRFGLAMAAGLALFFSGVLYGQATQNGGGDGQATSAQPGSESSPSKAVESAGLAYLSAISELAEMSGSVDESEYLEGREAAVRVFHEAAGEVAILVPEDRLAGEILRGLEYSRGAREGSNDESQYFVWF